MKFPVVTDEPTAPEFLSFEDLPTSSYREWLQERWEDKGRKSLGFRALDTYDALADRESVTASEIVPLVETLHRRGRRLGVLSNTCDAHWDFVAGGLLAPLLPRFDVLALSYQLQAMKPDAAIYARAAELAGVRPEEIFFTDDRPENIAAAQTAGYQAALFTTAGNLHAELARRELL